ncbi:DISARM system phospholipase D-like protein DrmC [Streptomyces melanogenes]|uniref:DISARM system phospholipase D-like protein DrmC n=1 Tax=Streptomyces melanogenes TaxID=67326 RepID=UPI00167E78ED|nr:DISARM system phospholipase D-like protein DrmC [Streptomyces melanogenes]
MSAEKTGRDRAHTGSDQPRRLPSLLAALCHRLPEDRLSEWEAFFESVAGPDDPLFHRFVSGQAAVGLSRQLMEITKAWRAESPSLGGDGLALAMAAARARPRPRPVQAVVSGPTSSAMLARLTSGVTLDVIRSAHSSLIIVSYAAHGASEVITEIRAAIRRGVEVDLLLEESTQAATAFANLPRQARIWHRTESPFGGVLHAKFVAADRDTALLGSANLTDRALSHNIELGVLLRDSRVVGPLVDHFRWLISEESAFMRRIGR